ncbi:ATPase [Erysipelotrichaceae bacterium]|nr:ATPase [Erysipelotrichaceae bacterium]
MEVLIGIDAGGTKTNLVAYEKNGAEIAIYRTNAANLTNDRGQAISTIIEGIAALRGENDWEISHVSIGMAGVVKNPLLPEMIAKIEEIYDTTVCVVNDVVFAHKAIFKNNAGLLLSAGTGSIAVFRAEKSEDFIIIGGHGHLFGDYGSGYDIAKRALVYTMEGTDSGKTDQLMQAICQKLGVAEIRAAIPRLYNAPKSEIASLAAIVAKLAADGDTICCRILDESAEQFCSKILAVIKSKGYSVQKFALWGSVFQKNERSAAIIKNRFSLEGITDEMLVSDLEITTAVLYEK